jgi:integrase/recombinase XerD
MAWEAPMTGRIEWESHVKDYLSYRRRLGFEMFADEVRLMDFARFATESNLESLSIESAINWAKKSKRNNPLTWTNRLSDLRGFAVYLRARNTDQNVEIPPANYFGAVYRRRIPHIYTKAEVMNILRESEKLWPKDGLRPRTCAVVFGLMASTGMRVSEVLKLRRNDFDTASGIIYIRDAKFNKHRSIPVHQTVANVLKDYSQFRDRFSGSANSEQYFLFDGGNPPSCRNLLDALRVVCKRLGLQPKGDYELHRLHDFRHTYIVNAVLRSQTGTNADTIISSLSSYVGHVKVTDTYWYLTGIPELLSLAAERFRAFDVEYK